MLSDPTLVFLLITLGLAGIGVEVNAPGSFGPGIIGVASLVLGVIGAIEIGNFGAGLGLLLVAVALFVAAAALRHTRPLSALGALALIGAGIFMFNRDTDPTSIIAVVIGAGVVGAFMTFVVERAEGVRDKPPLTGWEELIGSTGAIRSGRLRDDRSVAQVFVNGALWEARLSSESDPVEMGDTVKVEQVDGLTLVVRKFDRSEAVTLQTDTEGVSN
ncbi:MAG: NfeD family protein [Solirubrobacterales bacterium]